MRRQLIVLTVFITCRVAVMAQPVWNTAEQCAEMARRVSDLPGATLGMKLRHVDQRWASFEGTNEQLEARVLAEYPCMKHRLDAERCVAVQREVNGTTLGATLVNE
jgi:hypothetical protein